METGNESIELAATYLLTNDSPEDVQSDQWEDINENFKMVFLVNSELNMSVGKTAAQASNQGIKPGLQSLLC